MNDNLKIVLDTNVRDRANTSETEVNSILLNAPVLNLAPYDKWHGIASPYNCNGVWTDEHGSFHFDFKNGFSQSTSSRRLFSWNEPYKQIDFKPGDYSFCFRIKKLKGTYSLGSLNCPIYVYDTVSLKSTTLYPRTVTINPASVKDMVYTINFTIEEGQYVTFIAVGIDFLSNNVAARDLSFDLEILGIFNGVVSIDRASNTFGEKPCVTISNSEAVLGKYEINKQVLRHINQLERHIKAQDNVFDIKFR